MMDCPYHENCEVVVCDTRWAEAQEAIRELNERAASHLIAALSACGKACLERDQARAALRRAEAEIQRLRALLPPIP